MLQQSSSDLYLHTPGSHRITPEQLSQLPYPESLGPRHKPVAHHSLVSELIYQIHRRGWSITKQEFAVARKGQLLFGVMDLRGLRVPDSGDTGTSFGFRSSVNRLVAIRGVAGARVFVCDNLALSGEEFVMKHKHTTLLNLPHLIASGLDRFEAQNEALQLDIQRLKSLGLNGDGAKTVIFDLFNNGALPLHLFDDVSANYFNPPAEHTDCHPRTMWGVHNACTRAVQTLSPGAQFQASVRLGREFKLATKEAA